MKHRNNLVASKHRLAKLKSTTFCFTITALCLFNSIAHSQTSNQSFLVGIALDKTITIQANNASLKAVLLEIEAKTGIPVNFVADTSERVSVNLEGQTIENAIGKLTPNYMIMRDIQGGKEIISEIIIISDDPASTSSGGGSSFLPSGKPTPVIVDEGVAPPNPESTNDPAQNQAEPEPQNIQPTPAPTN